MAESPARGRRRGDTRDGPRSECCRRAYEDTNVVPVTPTACHGTVWTRAVRGKCLEAAAGGQTCEMDAITPIDVHQYSLAWVLTPDTHVGVCQATPTGATRTIEVADCSGNTCP